jgi:phospholipid transport system transporter-binding protein
MITLPAKVNHQNALMVRDDGLSQIQKSEDMVDASSLQEFDSSIIAVILAWLRAQPNLKMVNSPEKLQVLSKVYGLDGLLQIHSQKNI